MSLKEMRKIIGSDIRCAKCGEMAVECHHLFSNSKLNQKLYGELIHDARNLQYLCWHHHHSAPLDKLSEKEFCEALGVAIQSKTGKQTEMRF